ncbi:MAG: protein kinase, partial [Candidatus Fimenecus sp.]
KAAENEHIAATLMELETMALQEAEESCGMLKMGDKPITREMFIEMSEQDKETVMYYLSGAGLQEFVPSMTEGKITVTFTPHIQRVLGCTMFSVLNRLEKLDGAFNVMFPKATLELRVPLGAKKGMMKCEMLIMQLYPWLSITETSTNTVSSTINIQPELETKAPAAETVKSSQGKEEKPFLDCAHNQHEFEIAEQYCDATKYVCKKCGESKIETSRQCGNVDKDGVDEKRYCAQCGNVIHKNARFCTNCGKTVSYKSETASPKPIGVGTIIDGKYELLKLIGQGGTFKVFLAMDVRLNKIWAVKILRDDYHDADYDKQGMLRVTALQEASLLQVLNHPAIPSVVDIIDVPGCFATVQDYVEGETLNKIVKNFGAQPVDLVMDWAKQLCAVLAYLHALNPPHIHRDIKPDNLILEPNGCIKIIDFGIMRTYKPNQKNDTCSLGTKGYAAPEQYGGRGQTDARTDIYGVGMTLYHLLTGIDPRGENFVVRPLCQVNPALPKGTEYIIDKCIQLNPEDRYQNCTELLNDLTHYMELPR